MNDVEAAVLFARHDGDCPLCGGEDRVRVSVVRRRPADGEHVADPVASVTACPLLPRLVQMFGAAPARPWGGAA